MSKSNGGGGKREGMARAARAADQHWWQCMLECVRAVAESKPWFFTDDIEAMRQRLHPNASTHEGRALGPLMLQAQKLGYCVPTQDWVESNQATNHRRPCRVWWSLIYKKKRPRHCPRPRRVLDPRQIGFDI